MFQTRSVKTFVKYSTALTTFGALNNTTAKKPTCKDKDTSVSIVGRPLLDFNPSESEQSRPPCPILSEKRIEENDISLMQLGRSRLEGSDDGQSVDAPKSGGEFLQNFVNSDTLPIGRKFSSESQQQVSDSLNNVRAASLQRKEASDQENSAISSCLKEKSTSGIAEKAGDLELLFRSGLDAAVELQSFPGPIVGQFVRAALTTLRNEREILIDNCGTIFSDPAYCEAAIGYAEKVLAEDPKRLAQLLRGMEAEVGLLPPMEASAFHQQHTRDRCVSKEWESLRDMWKCELCRDVLAAPMVVNPCSHSFCGACLQDHLEKCVVDGDATAEVVTRCPYPNCGIPIKGQTFERNADQHLFDEVEKISRTSSSSSAEVAGWEERRQRYFKLAREQTRRERETRDKREGRGQGGESGDEGSEEENLSHKVGAFIVLSFALALALMFLRKR